MDYFEDYKSCDHYDLKIMKQLYLDYGYKLDLKVTDDMGRKWNFRSAPNKSGGTTNYFNSISEMRDYIKNVIFNRAMENDSTDVEKISQLKNMFNIIRNDPNNSAYWINLLSERKTK